jgi:hypothetical protein
LPRIYESIEAGKKLADSDRESLIKLAQDALQWKPQNP